MLEILIYISNPRLQSATKLACKPEVQFLLSQKKTGVSKKVEQKGIKGRSLWTLIRDYIECRMQTGIKIKNKIDRSKKLTYKFSHRIGLNPKQMRI